MSDGVKAIRVHRQSLGGVDSSRQIPNIDSILVEHTNGVYKYQVNSIQIDPLDNDAFYLTIKPEHNTVPTGSSSSVTIFSPYSVTAFKNSDYNAIINNATDIRDSGIFMKVDNQGSQLTPSNLSGINSRSLPFAEIQDSNYDSKAYTNIRHSGVKHQASDFNTIAGATGLVPVDSSRTYFAIFNWIGGTSPDLPRKSQASIKYIVDLEGNVTSPNDSNEVVNIVKQNFAQGEEVIITLDDPTFSGNDMQGLNGIQTIHKGGQRIENIISGISSSYQSAVTASFLWFKKSDGTFNLVGDSLSPLGDGKFTQTTSNTPEITGSFSEDVLSGEYRFVGIADTTGGGVIIENTPTNGLLKYLPTEQAGYLRPTKNFTISRGDIITFLSGSKEDYHEYLIEEVDSGSALSELRLRLDKPIDLTQYEARGYSIRRYVDASGAIILDTDKPPGGTSGGIIQPKHLPQGSEEKLQDIIASLKEKRII